MDWQAHDSRSGRGKLQRLLGRVGIDAKEGHYTAAERRYPGLHPDAFDDLAHCWLAEGTERDDIGALRRVIRHWWREILAAKIGARLEGLWR